MDIQVDGYMSGMHFDSYFRIIDIGYSFKGALYIETLNTISSKLTNDGDTFTLFNAKITKRIDSKGKSYLVFDTIDGNPYNIYMFFHGRYKHPFEEKYGYEGIKLKKVVYRGKPVGPSYDSIYYIDHCEFLLTKDNSILKLSAKELFKYIASMNMRYCTITTVDKFFKESLLGHLNIICDTPAIMIKENSRLAEYVELEQSTEHDDEFNKWKNKLILTGQHFDCNEARLLSYEINSERVVLPNIIGLHHKAFEKSPVKEIVLTSPETIIDNNFKYGFTKYLNKFGQPIKITKAYDKKLETPLFWHKPQNEFEAFLMSRSFNGTALMGLKVNNFMHNVKVQVSE